MDDCETVDKELKKMLECRPAFSHGGKTFMAPLETAYVACFLDTSPFDCLATFCASSCMPPL